MINFASSILVHDKYLSTMSEQIHRHLSPVVNPDVYDVVCVFQYDRAMTMNIQMMYLYLFTYQIEKIKIDR